MQYREKIVISLGGSLIVPNGGIDIDFLKKFNVFIRKKLAEDPLSFRSSGQVRRQFFIVVGGGATARHYRDAGRDVLEKELTPEDLDWLGVHATRLNAHLIRTIFKDVANPRFLKHYDIVRKVNEPVIVASGWRPGWSTDYCAAMVAEDYGADMVLNLSNIDMAYDKDPKEFVDAKPIKKTTWPEFRKIVGNEWIPGMNVPFDPIAAKKAEQLGLKVVILKGSDFENLEKYFRDEDFVGTVIEGK
ncbi:MAG: UMP kinase [Armatimonadetes bacterium]|nr:MAG: UMP kinase [Armatimonadota bacterium]